MFLFHLIGLFWGCIFPDTLRHCSYYSVFVWKCLVKKFNRYWSSLPSFLDQSIFPIPASNRASSSRILSSVSQTVSHAIVRFVWDRAASGSGKLIFLLILIFFLGKGLLENSFPCTFSLSLSFCSSFLLFLYYSSYIQNSLK